MAEPTQWALQQAVDFCSEWRAGVSHKQLALILDAARQQGYREGIASEEAQHNAAAFKACEREISRLKHENKDLRECVPRPDTGGQDAMSDDTPSAAAIEAADRLMDGPLFTMSWRTDARHVAIAQAFDTFAARLIAEKDAEIARLTKHADGNVDLVKACEHIACGDEGWEVLRNECPSTTAVAALRDAYEARGAEIATLRAALQSAIAVAEEARREWDAAPSGMRAGKILIALSGGCRGYRPDTDAIHAALALPTTPIPKEESKGE